MSQEQAQHFEELDFCASFRCRQLFLSPFVTVSPELSCANTDPKFGGAGRETEVDGPAALSTAGWGGGGAGALIPKDEVVDERRCETYVAASSPFAFHATPVV